MDKNNNIEINIDTKNHNIEDNTIKKKKKSIRQRIFEIVEVSQNGDILSFLYDMIMIINIVVSIVPLAVKEELTIFVYTDNVTVSFFILDYLLRLITADYKLEKKSFTSFLKYPFTMWAIIDFLSILPSITNISQKLRLIKMFNLIKTLKIIRLFKSFRYSKSLMIIGDVVKNSKYALYAVGTLSLGYILASALIMFNVEPQSFDTFFDAIYWSTVSLTTVGYGDLCPVTVEGRFVAMVSSVFGIAIIALPSGVITAGYMKSINERNELKLLEQLQKNSQLSRLDLVRQAVKNFRHKSTSDVITTIQIDNRNDAEKIDEDDELDLYNNTSI
jgi:voltage-gated potassium channel